MRARTVALVETVDLNDIAGGDGFLFVRDGVGMAGRGVAARVPADQASAIWSSPTCRAPPTAANPESNTETAPRRAAAHSRSKSNSTAVAAPITTRI